MFFVSCHSDNLIFMYNSGMNRDDLIRILSITDKQELQDLYARAYAVKKEYIGTTVHFRGIIEFSNICTKDCFYCGIRRSNHKLTRYLMNTQEILTAAEWAYQHKYGSIVLQSGERQDEEYVALIEELIHEIKRRTQGELGITLSLGEQTLETYERWYKAGAHRYLLRIETSNKTLYQKLHPADHLFDERISCLRFLKDIGYQTGTGVMIGLPGQTIEDLADDILFFKTIDIDMIGMGPWIPHEDAPLTAETYSRKAQLELGLKMIAATRLYLKNINIASTTALQTLSSTGRELGLQAGANVIMPNITPVKYRGSYQLYNGKPCLDDDSEQCQVCLEKTHSLYRRNHRLRRMGRQPARNNPLIPTFSRQTGEGEPR